MSIYLDLLLSVRALYHQVLSVTRSKYTAQCTIPIRGARMSLKLPAKSAIPCREVTRPAHCPMRIRGRRGHANMPRMVLCDSAGGKVMQTYRAWSYAIPRAARSCKYTAHWTTPIRGRRGHTNIPHISLLPPYISIAYFIYHSARSASINLNLAYLTKLDTAISRWYNTWVREAPQHYKADNFLSHHIPVAVTSLYGQNQPLPIWEDDDAEDSANWSRSHNFDRIKYLSISIATHLESVYIFYPSSPSHRSTFSSVRQTTGWTIRTIDDIINHHGSDIFDHYDPNIRRQLSRNRLTIFPLLNDDGTERPIYTELGYRIQRRFGTRSHSIRPLGVLMDLRHLDHLFLSDDLVNDFDSDAVSPSFDVYPQAGLVTAGHFQADGLMPAFIPLLHKLNSDIQLDANDLDVDDPFGPQDSLPPPIIGVGCQGYNAVMHATRGRCAQHHDAQRGLVTGALSASWANTPLHKLKARSLIQQCNHRLPHVEFRTKISNNNDDPLDCSLRLENTFVIDMQRLHPEYRNGANFLQDIILPLGLLWSHPTILDVIKDHTILFKPEVFSPSNYCLPTLTVFQVYPELYNWTTFPLVTFIEKIYQQCSQMTHGDASAHPDPALVELCSVAERALNYMHTGNAAVIATSVMNPLWIGNAIVRDGLPCFNSRIVSLKHKGPVSVVLERWPYDMIRHQPKTSSKAAQIFQYCVGHFNVSRLT